MRRSLAGRRGTPRTLHQSEQEVTAVRTYTAIIERDTDTGYYLGYIPGLPGAHSQGETLDELRRNLHEVTRMLIRDSDDQPLGSEYVGTQQIVVE